MQNPVHWFEIYVDDMPSAKKFYEEVFQVELSPISHAGTETPNHSVIELLGFPADMGKGGCTGSLVHMEGVKAGGNSCIVYFACEDCALTAERAAKAGGKIFRTKFPITPYGFIALVADNQGNLIGLHSMV